MYTVALPGRYSPREQTDRLGESSAPKKYWTPQLDCTAFHKPVKGCAFCVLRTRAAECGLSIARIDRQITMRPVGLTERTMISRSMDGPLYGECSICALKSMLVRSHLNRTSKLHDLKPLFKALRSDCWNST